MTTTKRPLKIAVASGKGGTGKTLVAVNLALSVGADQVLDCDVEEPNDHIFLNPVNVWNEKVEVLVPEINEMKCSYCRRCAEFCQYNALFVAGDTAMVFKELCHSCGGCKLICPEEAITETSRDIGEVLIGKRKNIELVYGKLKVGEALAVPVISAVKNKSKKVGLIVLDSPPGSACPVVESILGSDYCLMVTEPTPFGLHDLKVAVEVVRQLEIPIGVLVNFAGVGNREVYEFCEKEGIPIIMEIPYNRRIAELYSRGIPFIYEMPEWGLEFQRVLDRIREQIA